MAEADHNPKTETWGTLQAAHPLVVKICLSPSEAGPWLVKQIAAEKVRVRSRSVRPAGASIDWKGSPPTIDFADNSVTKLVVAPPGTVVGLCPVTLLGVEVVLEDIKALHLSIEPVTPESVTPKLVAMTAEQKRVWLRKAKRDRQWRPDEETFREYAKEMTALQKTVCSNPWSVQTMERRLRDKDEDD
jgi:hypothetical protein